MNGGTEVGEDREAARARAAVREAARARAVARVRDVLSVPEGLKRIDSLCAQTERTKSGVDAQLKATADAHLGAARASIGAVSRARTTLADVQQSYVQLDRLCAECSGLLADRDYAAIQRLQLVRENVRTTLAQVRAVEEIPARVAALRAELADPGRCLNAVHRQLVGLEAFAAAAAEQGRQNAAMLAVLREPVALVQALCREYEAELAKTFRGTIALAVSAPWTLVRANQAVERQEAVDAENARKRRSAAAAAAAAATANKTEEQTGDTSGTTKPAQQPQQQQPRQQQEQTEEMLGRRWRELRGQALKESIDERFSAVLGNVPDKIAESAQYTELCDMLLDDLETVYDKAAACFPPDVHVFELYAESYHQHFYKELQQLGRKHPHMPNSAIVAVMQWVFRDYQTRLTRLGVGRLEPPIESSLTTLEMMYNKNIGDKMFEWVPGVIANSRGKEPVLVDGQLFTTAPVDLFDLMNAQLAVARSTGSQMLAMRISSVITAGVIEFCRCLAREVEGERWRDVDTALLIATVNDANHCLELVDAIEEKIVAPLGAEDRLAINFEPARSELSALVATYLDALVRHIFEDVQETTTQLFTESWLPDGVSATDGSSGDGDDDDGEGDITGPSDLVSEILDCFAEYLDDNIEPCMLGFFVARVCTGLLDRLVFRYVEELLHKLGNYTILTSSAARALMDHDEGAIRDFFVQRGGLKEAVVEERCAVLGDVCTLFTEDIAMISFAVLHLLRTFSDFTPEILSAILAARTRASSKQPGHLSREQVQDILASCTEQFAKAAREKAAPGTPKKRPFFASIKVATSILAKLH